MRELCGAAESLAAGHDPAEALIAWLRLIDARATVNNGLAAAMAADEDGGAPGSLQSCHAMVAAAGSTLLERAISSGAVRPDVDIRDLLDWSTLSPAPAEDMTAPPATRTGCSRWPSPG